MFDWSLHHPNEPSFILHLQQLLTHVQIPEETASGWVSFREGLSAQTKVVLVTEVVALFKEVIF